MTISECSINDRTPPAVPCLPGFKRLDLPYPRMSGRAPALPDIRTQAIRPSSRTFRSAPVN